MCALSSLNRLVVGTLPVLPWPRRLSCKGCSNDPGRPSVACRTVAPWGPTLASVIDYRSDALLRLMRVFTSN